MHGPRLEQKTGLPDSYTIAKTEVSNWHAAQQIVKRRFLSLSWRLRRGRRRKRGKGEGRRGESRGKKKRGEQKRRRETKGRG